MKNISLNGSFLHGKAFKIFRDTFIKENDQILQRSQNETPGDQMDKRYWNFMVQIITRLFKINPEQVWNDFNGYLNINDDPEQIAQNDYWPALKSPWKTYFGNKEFDVLINIVYGEKMDKERQNQTGRVFPTNNFDSDRMVFQKRGIIIAFYMLKTLCEEYTPTILRADIEPDVMYANSTLFIYSDLIETNYINDIRGRLLLQTNHNVATNSQNAFVRQRFNPIQYKQCAAGMIDLDLFHINISSLLGKEIPFQRGPVFIELHFIRERSL